VRNRRRQDKRSESCDAFSTKFMQMCSKIEFIMGGFGLIKRFFYYRNKWSNSGPDNFGLSKRADPAANGRC